MRPSKLLKDFHGKAERLGIELRFGVENKREKVVQDFTDLSTIVVSLLSSSKSVENNQAMGTTMSNICNLMLEAVIVPPLTDEQRTEYTNKKAGYITLMESDGLSPLNAGPTNTRALVTNNAKR